MFRSDVNLIRVLSCSVLVADIHFLLVIGLQALLIGVLFRRANLPSSIFISDLLSSSPISV